MGKKIRSEMQKQRSRFVSGCVERDIDRGQAEMIFELLERFADYGFNKSHAAAYALVAYQTAYMKTNYPVEFLAASMTLDMGNTDKLSEFRAEARAARHQGRAAVDQPLRRGLRGRRQHHPLRARRAQRRRPAGGRGDRRRARSARRFTDLADFAARIDPHAVNKRVLESLAAAGAFDALDGNRARVFAAVDTMLATAQRAHEDVAVGQSELFGGGSAHSRSRSATSSPGFPPSGCRRSSTPSASFSPAIRSTITPPRSSACGCSRGPSLPAPCAPARMSGRVAGTVVARTERRTRTGSKMGIIGLSDPTGHYEAVVFSEGLAQFRDLLEPGAAVLLMLSAELQGDDVRARIQMVEPLDQAAAKLSKGLRVFLRAEAPIESVAKRLEAPATGRMAAGPGRGRARPAAGGGDRSRGEAAGTFQGLAADRRRHQGGAGRGRGRGGVIRLRPR